MMAHYRPLPTEELSPLEESPAVPVSSRHTFQTWRRPSKTLDAASLPAHLFSSRRRPPDPCEQPQTFFTTIDREGVAAPMLFNTLGDVLEFAPDSNHWSRHFSFVQRGRFQMFAGCVILLNTFMIAAELRNPDVEATLFWPEQAVLCFYIFELVSRACFFHERFLHGPWRLVIWHLLDIAVVFTGVLEQWVLPFLPVSPDSPLQSFLGGLRLLRLVRILKLVRLILEANLAWADEPPFQSFIGAVILLNSLIMGVETDYKWDGWVVLEQVLLLIYVFELAVRLKRDRCGFFYGKDMMWNWMDFSIVVSSVMDQWLVPLGVAVLRRRDGGEQSQHGGMSFDQVMMLMRMLRLMRILRLVRLVKAVRPLYDMVMGVIAAIQGVFWTLVLVIVTLYAFGIMATRLVGHGMVFTRDEAIDPAVMRPFATVPDSMFSLFKVMSGTQTDDDAAAVEVLMGQVPAIKFVFVWFMVASSWTLLSILTAVVSENMISTTEEQKKMMKLATAEHDQQEHIDELMSLFSRLDENGNGTIEPQELENFLKTQSNREECAHICRVPAKDVVEVLRVLREEDGQPVDIQHFMECLTIVGDPVTEKSIMKLEARFTALENMTRGVAEDLRERANRDTLYAQEHLDSVVGKLLDRFDRFDRKQAARHKEQVDARLSHEARLAALELDSRAVVHRIGDLVQQQAVFFEEFARRPAASASAEAALDKTGPETAPEQNGDTRANGVSDGSLHVVIPSACKGADADPPEGHRKQRCSSPTCAASTTSSEALASASPGAVANEPRTISRIGVPVNASAVASAVRGGPPVRARSLEEGEVFETDVHVIPEGESV